MLATIALLTLGARKNRFAAESRSTTA